MDSEVYEDALSKLDVQSKTNINGSLYQDAQSKLGNNSSKRNKTKKSESSVYEDAQSKLTSNSIIYCKGKLKFLIKIILCIIKIYINQKL